MRTIKFRGIPVDFENDGDNFIYGDYNYNVVNAYSKIIGHAIKQNTVYPIEVHSSSVGQFMGLKDKNGKEIYEGDILETEDSSFGYVVWDDAAFAIKSPGSEAIDWEHSSFYEKSRVIGNIHENPELL